MNQRSIRIKKLAVAGMLAAVAVACSPLSIPVGASRCYPVQHLVNVLAAVFLGPWYGFGMAFATSLVRNLLSTGSLLAFPGSMFGALLCGFTYKKTKNIFLTCRAEVFGTAVIGGLAAYPLSPASAPQWWRPACHLRRSPGPRTGGRRHRRCCLSPPERR